MCDIFIKNLIVQLGSLENDFEINAINLIVWL